jgi:cell division protein FtsI/penicillin-binding protein 2
MAFSAIANGGKLMAPHLLKSLSGSDGKVVKEFQPSVVREVVSEETASIIREALSSVVGPGGTALAASVPGFRVGGKTGTAQIPDGKGGYYKNRYLASFVGFMPVEDPAFVCLVMIEDPKVGPRGYFGGLVAAPIFSNIAQRAARYLDLQPTLRAIPVAEVVSNSKPTPGDVVDQ